MIRIIADSASDMTVEEGKELGIEIIPLEITIGKDTYLDGETIKRENFYDLLESSKDLPKTSQINPYRYEEIFKRIKEQGDQAIVITLSSKLSGTYQNAVLAKADYDNVRVVDGYTVALGERLLIMHAKELISEGKSIDEIVNILDEEKKRIKLIAKLDTLKFLRKGGRISSLVAFAGEALHIKPIVGIIDGEVKFLGKGRGLAHANKVLTKMVLEYGGIDEDMPFGTIYSGNSDEMLKKYINSCKELVETGKNIDIYWLGCTIGTHIGPNAIGVGFFSKEY